jgi:hypothetical protein
LLQPVPVFQGQVSGYALRKPAVPDTLKYAPGVIILMRSLAQSCAVHNQVCLNSLQKSLSLGSFLDSCNIFNFSIALLS